MILGIGTDLVHVPGFAAQLAQPGTAFADAFTGAECRAAEAKALVTGSAAPHLAARWAAKEAAIKAWSQALLGTPPPVDPARLILSDIEVRSDRWGRPYLHFAPGILEAISASLTEICAGSEPSWQLSLSHDGDYANAFVVLTT